MRQLFTVSRRRRLFFQSPPRAFPFSFRPFTLFQSIPRDPIFTDRTPLCQFPSHSVPFPSVTSRHYSFPSVMSAMSEMSDSGRRDPRNLLSQQLFTMRNVTAAVRFRFDFRDDFRDFEVLFSKL